MKQFLKTNYKPLILLMAPLYLMGCNGSDNETSVKGDGVSFMPNAQARIAVMETNNKTVDLKAIGSCPTSSMSPKVTALNINSSTKQNVMRLERILSVKDGDLVITNVKDNKYLNVPYNTTDFLSGAVLTVSCDDGKHEKVVPVTIQVIDGEDADISYAPDPQVAIGRYYVSLNPDNGNSGGGNSGGGNSGGGNSGGGNSGGTTNSKPVITSVTSNSGSFNFTNNATVVLTINATDANNDTLTYKLASAVDGLSVSGNRIIGNAKSTAGTKGVITLKVVANDSKVDSDVKEKKIYVNSSPTVTIIASSPSSKKANITFTSYDPDSIRKVELLYKKSTDSTYSVGRTYSFTDPNNSVQRFNNSASLTLASSGSYDFQVKVESVDATKPSGIETDGDAKTTITVQ